MPRRNQRDENVPPLAITPADVERPTDPDRLARQHHGPGASRVDLHPAHRARLEMEDAISQLRECAMPLCKQPPIYDPRAGSLGICWNHGTQIAIHFDRLDEVAPPVTEARIQREFKSRTAAASQARKSEERALAAGWIYYIRVDDRIKVGYSADVRERMRAYPPHAELLAVHPGTMTLETDLHRQFRDHRAAGREWYTPAPDLLAHIQQVLAQFGPPNPRHIYTFRTAGQAQQLRPHRRSRRIGSGQRRP